MTKRDPFIAIDTVDVGGKPVRVYPMTLGDAPMVEALIQRFNPELISMSMLTEDSRGAIVEIVKLATRLEEEALKEYTVYEIGEIVDSYLGLSKLKKKTEK